MGARGGAGAAGRRPRRRHRQADRRCSSPRAADVVAVEPLANMRAELERALPSVRVLDGSAERIPLPDGSADAVFVGQAFHWFDGPAALDEIARVLVPGGVLGLVWNLRDERVPWVADLTAALRGAGDVLTESRNIAGRPFTDARYTAASRRRVSEPRAASIARACARGRRRPSRIAVLPEAERERALDAVVGSRTTHPELARPRDVRHAVRRGRRAGDAALGSGRVRRPVQVDRAHPVDAVERAQVLERARRRARVEGEHHHRPLAAEVARDAHVGDVDALARRPSSPPGRSCRGGRRSASPPCGRRSSISTCWPSTSTSHGRFSRPIVVPRHGQAVAAAHPDQARVVAQRAGLPDSRTAMPRLLGHRPRVDEVDRLVGAGREGALITADVSRRVSCSASEPPDRPPRSARAAASHRPTASRPSCAASGRCGPSTSMSSAPHLGDVDGVGTNSPRSAATTCSATTTPARSCASWVDAPRCGVTTTFAIPSTRAGRVRLLREHVERGAGDLPAPRPSHQRVEVDQLAAGGVDDPHARAASAGAGRRRSGAASRR